MTVLILILQFRNDISFEIIPLSRRPADLIGDANLDRKINVSDAVFLGSYLTNKRESITLNVDINQDGMVNIFDMISLKRTIAGDEVTE
ncbi:MAG: dockerin type I repeat-containing protein [Porcipelethomonas sp.]